MIVIPRKKGDAIVIGEGVTITVIEIRGDKVRLGVQIPKEMSLHRMEVYDAIYGTADSGDLDPFDPDLFP